MHSFVTEDPTAVLEILGWREVYNVCAIAAIIKKF